MDVREKLIKLIENGVPCPDGRDPFGEYCDKCRYSESADCSNERLADYLISHGVTVQEWISVDDRLPEEDGHYLCNYHFVNHWWMTFTSVLDYYATDPVPHFQHVLGDTTMQVTHWMMLPKPPRGE